MSASSTRPRRSFRPRKPGSKPSSKKQLQSLPYVLLREIVLYLEAKSYLSFTGTSKAIRALQQDDTIASNHACDISTILTLVFYQGRNVFLTGSAGTGKTYIMNMIYKWAKRLGRIVSMTATTGIASLNLTDGRTLHSFSGLRKGTIPIEALRQQLQAQEMKTPKVLSDCDLLLVDEVSMIGARFLEKLDTITKYARSSSAPLGGIPVVFSGDVLQLPPVADKFCFTSPIWEALDFAVVRLRFPFRQGQDMPYYRLLQRVRIGEPTEADYEFLEAKATFTQANLSVLEAQDIKPTRLMSKQKDVKAINQQEFSKLSTPVKQTLLAEDTVCARVIQGRRAYYVPSAGITLPNALAELKDRAEHQAPETIEFKDGLQLILTFNLELARQLVNGSRCVYRAGGKVEFLNGVVLELDDFRRTFYYPLSHGLFLRRKQVCLRLGYACTLHGSQGMTLDRAILNLGSSIFCSAQAYVGLSRVRSAEGLYISEFSRKSIKTHSGAQNYMKELETLTLSDTD